MKCSHYRRHQVHTPRISDSNLRFLVCLKRLASRWDVDEVEGRTGPANDVLARFGAFLPDAAAFDAQLFGVSPSEAALMDPQQRLLLDCSARLVPNVRRGDVSSDVHFSTSAASADHWGVYVGTSSADYGRLQALHVVAGGAYSATATALSVTSGRLAYTWGMRGPCVAVDTACSSSLVATHCGLAALQLSQCPGALIGGVNLTLIPDTPITFQRAGEG
jgi:acyl transferase domain-containing protein